MRSHISVGRFFGIKVGIHSSWFLIAVLLVFSLASGYRYNYPQWSSTVVISLAVASAILFFICLLLHEISHSLVARAEGIRVREITLFALGGVAELDGQAPSAGAEFWIAVVGPLTSAILGFACLYIVQAVSHDTASLSPWLTAISNLGYINISLAVFNLLPAYPMDGGRVLRAALWWKNKDLDSATRRALHVSQIIAVLLIVFGAASFLGARETGGLWMAFIGWFLLQTARENYLEMGVRYSLNSVRADQLMMRDFPAVDAHETVQHFVDNTLLQSGRRSYLVKSDDVVVGLVTPSEIKHLSPEKWFKTSVAEVMRPLRDMTSIAPGTSLLNAMRIMEERDVAQLPILMDGRLQGVLSRDTLLSYLQTMLELKSGPA